ncbi:MAG: site-specific integrase, partial [Acidimicrobiia bacterium]
TLRTFFERVSEWDYPDAPSRMLIFNGDLPTPDDPLPKFLTDVDAGKLMRAAAGEHPTRRLVIEMLARTGLRVGELCALTADAVIWMSGRHWLRVPVGKLHNDRYVPLHPQLVELLDTHQSQRSDDIDRLIVWNGGPLNRHQITRMLNRAAKAAGIGHVHPHQLRHTLATQAINRGMSLEAVAAMPTHVPNQRPARGPADRRGHKNERSYVRYSSRNRAGRGLRYGVSSSRCSSRITRFVGRFATHDGPNGTLPAA